MLPKSQEAAGRVSISGAAPNHSAMIWGKHVAELIGASPQTKFSLEGVTWCQPHLLWIRASPAVGGHTSEERRETGGSVFC